MADGLTVKAVLGLNKEGEVNTVLYLFDPQTQHVDYARSLKIENPRGAFVTDHFGKSISFDDEFTSKTLSPATKEQVLAAAVLGLNKDGYPDWRVVT